MAAPVAATTVEAAIAVPATVQLAWPLKRSYQAPRILEARGASVVAVAVTLAVAAFEAVTTLEAIVVPVALGLAWPP